eukprot:gene2197-27364_t
MMRCAICREQVVCSQIDEQQCQGYVRLDDESSTTCNDFCNNQNMKCVSSYANGNGGSTEWEWVVGGKTCRATSGNQGCYVSGVPEMLCRCSCDDCDHQDLAHLYGPCKDAECGEDRLCVPDGDERKCKCARGRFVM